MSQLRLSIGGERCAFEPCEKVEGTASWSLENEPEAVDIRLFWYTRGKGDRDVEIVQQESFCDSGGLAAYGERDFSFQLPLGPHSFSGKLISLIWAIELIIQPKNETERVEFVLAPGGHEIDVLGLVT